nr:MAG TPA: hypothetical protein [Caudoviricetes sp.]DAR66803.1 MAG TPA: hypothetical protein [Caudoviricetes sp.]DAU85145.1 MAG TPA: hypothetical protein [Caudoviricetes sp.]DAX45438.1 MAG TPA: hypothetical protein [Caudoviricetes sp.]
MTGQSAKTYPNNNLPIQVISINASRLTIRRLSAILITNQIH